MAREHRVRPPRWRGSIEISQNLCRIDPQVRQDARAKPTLCVWIDQDLLVALQDIDFECAPLRIGDPKLRHPRVRIKRHLADPVDPSRAR